MIGIYGGTFNPIHQAHLRAAEEVVEQLALERMIFVPSARPPHKRATEEDLIAPARERLAWVEMATRDEPRFAVDAIELERAGPSYLVDTLETLRSRHGGEPPVFSVGRDAFCEMGSWREPERILRLAHIAVTTRPPREEGRLGDWLPACLRDAVEVARDGRSARHASAGTWIRQLPITDLDISASGVRARLRAGRSIRYLLPEDVRRAVEASGCYVDAHPLPDSADREGLA